MARPFQKLTAQIENVIRAEARGEPHNEILEKYFGITPDSDQKARHNAQCKMSDWRKRPDYKAIWEDELAAVVRRRVPGAVNRLNIQIDNQNDWVANKASNDVISLAKALGVIKTEESAIKVQIEGMPDLGSPDDDG